MTPSSTSSCSAQLTIIPSKNAINPHLFHRKTQISHSEPRSPRFTVGIFMSSTNASALYIIAPPFLWLAFAKSAFRSLLPLCFSQTRRKSSSCHYVFRRLASRQPYDINSDESRQRILEQISGFWRKYTIFSTSDIISPHDISLKKLRQGLSAH